ncbi:DUF3800 domain-containing protein [Halodesulfovibrio aestuarii]|uniref:DUF3800 domain-containing protein n=1 Tax=Halodesulfovibrio aestuarii TaxID=126333 RepID=UPI003D338686
MFCYIDESGNSGNNLFDENQPFYYSLSISTPVDFNKIFASNIQTLCKKIKIDELHANEIGLTQLNLIAKDLLKVLQKSRATFQFCILEKKYLAATKLFDTLFDPGENPAAPIMGYNYYALRMLLCIKLCHILDEETALLFWKNCLMSREEKASQSFQKVCEVLLANVSLIPDERFQQIFTDVLTFAIKHPKDITYFTSKKKDTLDHSPNFVAFTSVLQLICQQAEKSKRSIQSVTHDGQNQFEKTFAYYFEHAQISKPLKLPKQVTGPNRMNLYLLKDSTFTVVDSHSNYALQVTDAVLYLLKKQFEGEKFHGHLEKLIKHINTKTAEQYFTVDAAELSVVAEFYKIFTNELSSEKFEAAKKLTLDLEDVRQQRMSAREELTSHSISSEVS